MRALGIGLMLLASTGCAGLEARKVSLDKRLAGADTHVQGFRYYLSRPYLVVNERICVTKMHEETVLGELGPRADAAAPEMVLKGMDSEGRDIFFDLTGKPLLIPEGRSFEPVRFEAVIQRVPKKDTNKEPDEKPEKAPLNEKEKTVQDKLKPKLDFPPTIPTQGKPSIYSPKVLATPGTRETTDPPPVPKLEIIHLPDFEEQMAVKSVNFLSKSKFSMIFADGWQLESVKGNHDSTAIPSAILDLVKSAISAATEVQEQRIKKGPANGGNRDSGTQNIRLTHVLITRCTYIEPGVYRLQKPSEMGGRCAGGLGLLADLGIPLRGDTRVHLMGE